MIVDFGDYKYFKGDDSDKNTYTSQQKPDKAFSSDEFSKLMRNRQYLDAARYAEQYIPTDAATRKQYTNYILNLKRDGRKLEAIYGRLKERDETLIPKVEFYDAVFTDGGLEQFSTNPNYSNYNPYVDKFMKLKENIGASIDDGLLSTDYKPNNTIGVVFKPEKQTGLFGIDLLAADNKDNITAFYDATGLSRAKLEEAGVRVINRDGETELKFDKSNALANTILYNTAVRHYATLGSDEYNHPYAPQIVGYDDKGNRVEYVNNGLREFKELIDDVKSAKDDAFKELDLEYKNYSSTATHWISDELYALQQQGLTDEEYNRKARTVAPEIFDALYSLGSANYEMYGNLNNKDNDETLDELDNSSRHEMMDIISSAAPSELVVDAMVSNGKVGALVTVKRKVDAKGTEVRPEYQVFIPGLLQEQAQERINRDTSTRAVQELNNMIDWGYDYTLDASDNGKKISVGANGKFYIDGEEKNKDEVIRAINKDMMIEDLSVNLAFKHINANNEFFGREGYEKDARTACILALDELYDDMHVEVDPRTGNTYIVDMYKNIYNPDDIFNRKIDKDNTNYKVYSAMENIYSMYQTLMASINKYL